MTKLTIQDLKDSGKTFFTPADISGVLGSDPQTIRTQAHQRPELLGFPVLIIGNRVKIPSIPFLAFIGAVEAPQV